MSYTDSIYSPETSGTEAANQALVLRQREHQQLVQQWYAQKVREQEAIDALRRQNEQQMALVRQERANNWAEGDRLSSDRRNLEHENSVLRRDRELVRQKDHQLQELEIQRRRNRTTSMAYIEDTFPNISPRDVVGLLTASSPRVRDHAMNNLSTCINGSSEVAPPLVRLRAQDIAPFVLPKLHQLLSASKQPIESVSKFCKDLVSSPPMAKALAMSGECPRLTDYLIELNERISTLAICSLRQMIRMETAVVKAAYGSLAVTVPQIPIPSSPQEPYHPSVTFIEEMAPKIIEDCFNNGLWFAVSPLVSHKIACIRQVVLAKIVLEARNSDRTQHGLVEAHTLGLLDHYFESPSPPSDVVDFFINILPSIAIKLCRSQDRVLWLLRRLSDPSPKINNAVVQALQASAMKQDSAIHDIFVKAEVLRHLDELPTQSSFSTTKLICDLLPVLAIAHARKNKCFSIIRFLDNSEVAISNACLLACTKIVDSTVENRAHLLSVFAKLNFAKESSRRLCEIAMPAFCRDWAAEGAFVNIAKLLAHQERCVRVAANRIWLEVVSNTPSARTKIVTDNLLGIFFDLCSSPNDDSVTLGCRTLPFMALEISRAGVGPSRQLVNYLNHSLPELRQSTLQSIRIIAEGNDSDRAVLLEAGAFSAIVLAFQTNPQEAAEVAHKFLISMAPAVSTSADACWSLLQLLESSVPHVENAARSALAAISNTNIEYRETLRKVILKRLVLASDAFIEFSVRAIQEWIGADLAKLNDFSTFFDFVSHADRRIQNGALFSLRERLQDRGYQESLEKANIVFLIRTLASTDNPEAINFVAFALPSLALTLARNGHVSDILQLLTYNEPKIREGASGAIEAIASGSNVDRSHLMADDVLERLLGGNERLAQTELQLCATILPKLAVDYLHASKLNFIFTLIDHAQQPIRVAAARALSNIVGGTDAERAVLRDQLLPRLDTASPALREAASSALSRTLARDLVSNGDYTPLFRLFDNEDPRIRAPVIAELRRHIQGSDETVRKRLVDADILASVVHALRQPKDDLVSFTAEHVLPILGPSLSQSDGAVGVIPLLSHAEPRIRTAATIALRNAVDSHHGCVQKMVATAVVSQLHSLIDRDDAVRELWCHLLPQTAPYLSNLAEIETLLDCLGDCRPMVQEAASETISLMAKTSDETRLNLFPAMVHRLDAPSLDDAVTEHLAQAVSLSGFAFISNGQEAKLLRLIQNREPALVVAAVNAITQLLSRGGLYEHQKLLDRGIFAIALNLHKEPQQRELGLTLLYSVIPYLSHAIILKAGDAETLFSLFDDPDAELSQILYQSLVGDPRVFESATLPDLLPVLLDKGNNPKVSGLLCHMAPYMIPRLMSLRRVNVIMKLLTAGGEGNVARSYLQAIHDNAMDATEHERDLLADNSDFVPVLGDYLNSRNATLRRISSEIIEILADGSEWRAGRMMEEGIGRSLAWVAVKGETGAQRPSIDALAALLLAAPDHADRLVWECLPALHDILDDVHRSSEVYTSTLSLLAQITNKAAHSLLIIESGIIECVVQWLSPQHTNQNSDCRQLTFRISQRIAQHSDPGRKALIDSGVLPVLVRLIDDRITTNVTYGCKILDALAQTGTYREELLAAGVKNTLERITSPFRQSKLETKADKKTARAQARQVLLTLKSMKNSATDIQRNEAVSDTSPLQSARTSRLLGRQPTVRPVSTWMNDDALGVALPGQMRRSMSESVLRRTNGANIESPTDQTNGTVTEVTHARTASAPGGALNNRLSVVREEHTRPGLPAAIEVISATGTTDTGTPETHSSGQYEVNTTRNRPAFGSYREEPSHFRVGSFDSGLRRPPPSYRTMPSGSGSLRTTSNIPDYLSTGTSRRGGPPRRKFLEPV